jgi:hypothetical protein
MFIDKPAVQIFILHQFLKSIGAVYPPGIQKADADGVKGAIKGTTHTHLASKAETQGVVHQPDILRGTIAEAAQAQIALFFIDPVKDSVDPRAGPLDGEQKGDDPVHQGDPHKRGIPCPYIGGEDAALFFRGQIHLFGQVIRKPGDNIIGHEKMVVPKNFTTLQYV